MLDLNGKVLFTKNEKTIRNRINTTIEVNGWKQGVCLIQVEGQQEINNVYVK